MVPIPDLTKVNTKPAFLIVHTPDLFYFVYCSSKNGYDSHMIKFTLLNCTVFHVFSRLCSHHYSDFSVSVTLRNNSQI